MWFLIGDIWKDTYFRVGCQCPEPVGVLMTNGLYHHKTGSNECPTTTLRVLSSIKIFLQVVVPFSTYPLKSKRDQTFETRDVDRSWTGNRRKYWPSFDHWFFTWSENRSELPLQERLSVRLLPQVREWDPENSRSFFAPPAFLVWCIFRSTHSL